MTESEQQAGTPGSTAGTARRNSHCSWCGEPFLPDAPWPRTCVSCGQTSYLNPLPVAVLLLPVDDGLLVVRRTVPPGAGRLALPGGFINLGESWQQAATRELMEEARVAVAAETVQLYDAHSAPDGTLLVFGLAPGVDAGVLPPSQPTEETDGWTVLRTPEPLAFSLHTEVARRFLASH